MEGPEVLQLSLLGVASKCCVVLGGADHEPERANMLPINPRD